MMYRRVLIALASLALLATSACSTSSSAEKSGETATTKQAQTEEASEEDSGDEEMAEQEEASEDEGEDEEESADKEKMADKKKMKGGMCPMEVEGTKADIKKMEGAVAMDFTTDGDVEELRKRITKMAAMHNKHHSGKKKGMKKGKKKGKMKGEKHGKMKMMMAKTSAETEEIEGGMRMKVMPEKAENLDKLHTHMKQHHEKIAEGKGCPMKMMKGKTADAG